MDRNLSQKQVFSKKNFNFNVSEIFVFSVTIILFYYVISRQTLQGSCQKNIFSEYHAKSDFSLKNSIQMFLKKQFCLSGENW
jgi:hypothetical protein